MAKEKKKLTLWQIDEEIEALDEMLSMMDSGEITEEYEEMENKINEMLSSKVDGCYEYIDKLKTMVKISKERKAHFGHCEKMNQNKIDRFEGYIIACLEKSGKSCYTGDFAEFKMRKPKMTINVLDIEKIPDKFLKFIQASVSVNKVDLNSAYAKGEVELEGFEYLEGKKSLNIGMKKIGKKTKKAVKDESK